jgi:ABC-type proline/glycine betaine transport system permease subunit
MSEAESIYTYLESFQGIRHLRLRAMMRRLPVMLSLGVGIALLALKDSYLMYISMILAVVLSIIAFLLLMNRIPEALTAIWDQDIIGLRRDLYCGSDQSKKLSGPDEGTPEMRSLEGEYINFVKDFEGSLNDGRGQLLFGGVFSLILLSRSIYEFWTWLPHSFWIELIYKSGGIQALLDGIRFYFFVYLGKYSLEEPLRFWTGLTIEPFLGFIMGLIAWRMIITGSFLRRLGKEFDLTPRLQHHDKCGGLEPLGNLSLMNALIISIWGVFLGGWIILGSSEKYSFYAPMYQALLIVPIAMAVLSFILPLWSIHKVMALKRLILEKQLNIIMHRIHDIEKRRLDAASGLVSTPKNPAEDLEHLKAIHAANQIYPTWPFNYRILLAFASSQCVPLLGLTGLGAPILKVIASLQEFFNQMGGST